MQQQPSFQHYYATATTSGMDHAAGTVGVGSSAPSQWTTSLYDCFQDFSNCFITCCCPCITFGRNVEILENGITSCCNAGTIYFCLAHIGFLVCYTCTYRRKLRVSFNLPEEPCSDCLVHCFCIYCALCQEYRELKSRGLDPSLGWSGNDENWNQAHGITVPPAVTPGMAR